MSGISAGEIATRYGVNRARSGRYKIPEVCHGSANGKKDLAIWDGDGGSVGAKCHSRGCSYQTILDALGVEFTYSGRKHHYGNSSAADPVTRRRGRGRGKDKDLGGNPGTPKGLLVKLDAADVPEKIVVLVEGEKAFDALAAYGSESYTAAHWVGGVAAADLADYSPLKDRVVILWPDADEEGRAAMERAGIKAAARPEASCAGAASLSMVNTSELPDKADAADFDWETILKLLDAAEDWTPPPIVHPSNEAMGKGAFFSHDASGLAAAFLTLRLELRANARGGRIEVRRQDHGTNEALSFLSNVGLLPDPAGWAHLNDSAAAWCLNYWKEHNFGTNGARYKLSEEAFRRAILALTAGKNNDPVLEYLNGLPAWDGKERLPTLFTDALGAPATMLNGEIAKVLMIGLVERTTKPGSKHDELPVLVGAQGGGKSTFCEELLPPEYPGWHRTLDNLKAEDQKRVERIDNAAIVEFAELRILGGYGVVKNYLSDRYDSYRLPYQRAAQTIPRRWVGIGTANDEGEGVLPDDPTGNRRYVAVKVNPPGSTSEEQSAHVREYLGKHRTQLWAEAVVRFKRGEKSYIAGGFEKERDVMNTSYTRANQPLEQIAADLTSKHADGEPVALADLMIEAGLARDAVDAQEKMRKSGRKLAGYLTRLSWEKGRSMVDGVQKTLWTPPHLATPSEPAPAEAAEGWCIFCGASTTGGEVCEKAKCVGKVLEEWIEKAQDVGALGNGIYPVAESNIGPAHMHGCSGAEGWFHRAEAGIEPADCQPCKSHLHEHEDDAPPPGQVVLDGMPSSKH